MKITGLNIENYRQLKDLFLDFTYPDDYKDNSKAGKPLEKICFIGQSATGKTNLLQLIHDEYDVMNNTLISTSGNSFSREFENSEFIGDSKFILKDDKINLSQTELIVNKDKFQYISAGSFGPLIEDINKKPLFYFKADLISKSNIEIFSKNPIELVEIHPNFFNLNHAFNRHDKQAHIFDANMSYEFWLFLTVEILEYRKKFNQKMSDLIHKGLLANQKKLSVEFAKWQDENPNALEYFAHKLNPLFKKLNIEIDIVNTEYLIPILNKLNEDIIPIQNTSTGTKGLLLSFLPLFKLNTDDAIILIDEPERSLFPDMQMEIMEHYQNIAPKAQFIIATHSPFIAASFEPEERFILYFDDDGSVAVKRGNSPIGDDPNDMLKNDFGVNYYNKHGEKAYRDYLDLKQKVAVEQNPEKKKDLMLKIVKLGDTYNF